MNNPLAQLVSLIKVSLARRRLIAKIPYSNLNLNLLKILYYEGYIRGFKVTADLKKIYVFLKLNQFRSTLLDLAYFCPRNKHSYLTYKKLVGFFGLKTFGIVSTNSGLMTIDQCFIYKKGGTLVLLAK
jgi:ribosomal protein S8